METMTVTNNRFQFWLCISKFYDCTKFRYNQVAGEKIINDQNFQIFVSEHLNKISWQEVPQNPYASVKNLKNQIIFPDMKSFPQ